MVYSKVELPMAKTKQVLYIEDEEDTLQLVTILLENNGYEVIGVPNGESGLKAMKENKPDVVLLDLMLPGMSGKAVYKKMKSDDNLKDIPIVLLTAWGASSGVGLNKDLVEDYLLKPFSSRDLLDALSKVLS
jgi:DNA-binding response OmpR family regulator